MKIEIRSIIGNNIKLYREQKNMSQQTLANEIGVSKGSIQNWEYGRKIPNESSSKKLCDVLDVTFEDLLVHGDEATGEEANINRFINASTMAQNALKYLDKGDIIATEKCLHDVITYLNFCAASD